MGGSYIALLTGFYVDNGNFLPLWDRLPHLTYWLLPSLIGIPLIRLALRRFPPPRASGSVSGNARRKLHLEDQQRFPAWHHRRGRAHGDAKHGAGTGSRVSGPRAEAVPRERDGNEHQQDGEHPVQGG
jgi:hypothetical protein